MRLDEYEYVNEYEHVRPSIYLRWNASEYLRTTEWKLYDYMPKCIDEMGYEYTRPNEDK